MGNPITQNLCVSVYIQSKRFVLMEDMDWFFELVIIIKLTIYLVGFVVLLFHLFLFTAMFSIPPRSISIPTAPLKTFYQPPTLPDPVTFTCKLQHTNSLYAGLVFYRIPKPSSMALMLQPQVDFLIYSSQILYLLITQ